MTSLPKRKHMNLRVKLDACLDALGLLGKPIQWDHDPPLGLREEVKDEEGNVIGFVPDENDPRHIRPRLTEEHARKTNGDPHVKVNGDKSKIAKARNLAEGNALLRAFLADRQAAREAREAKRAKSKWPSRKFNQQRKKPQHKGHRHDASTRN